MAYEIVGPAVLQVTFEGLLYGQQVMTVMSYMYDDTVPIDGPDAILAAREDINLTGTGLYALYRECLSEDVMFLMQHYQWITPTRYAYVTFIPTAREGVIPSPAALSNTACVVTRRGQVAARDQISNLHLPGLPAAVITSGLLSEAQLDRMDAFGEESLSPLDNGAFLSLFPVAFKRSAPENSRRLFTQYPQATARDMRRRTVRVGS